MKRFYDKKDKKKQTKKNKQKHGSTSFLVRHILIAVWMCGYLDVRTYIN